MLEMSKIFFRYNKKSPMILEGINISFKEGEFVCIVGRNGSGKTTITRLLTGLEMPVEGKIIHDDEDITKMKASGRSSFIGYVFQQPDRQMFMPKVEEEVAFGPIQKGIKGQKLKEIVEEALEICKISDLRNKYPRTLNRGNQQRVAIASALAMKTKYIILDEPTSGQDNVEKLRLVKLMKDLVSKGIGVILVTHDMDIVAQYSDCVIAISNNKIAFDGNPDELFSGKYHLKELKLAYPDSVLLGRELKGQPYCKNMNVFMKEFERVKGVI